MRLLALLVAAAVLAGCSGDGSSDATRSRSVTARESGADPAAHTPTDLRHPCEIVGTAAASRLLGQQVLAVKVRSDLAPRTLSCSYRPRRSDTGTAVVEVGSKPDPTPLAALVGLYVGVDRLRHHPVDVPGADDAVVVSDPESGHVTVFAKQGFVTHTVVVSDDVGFAERLAVRMAVLVVAGNRLGRTAGARPSSATRRTPPRRRSAP